MAAENIEDTIIVTNWDKETDETRLVSRQESNLAPIDFVPGIITDRDKRAKHNSSAPCIEDVSDTL